MASSPSDSSEPSTSDETVSLEDKRALLSGSFPHDQYTLSPRHLTDRMAEAVDSRSAHFEPLSYTPPEAWKRVEQVVGGNRDIDGHFERTVWDHPLYGIVSVESKRGSEFFTGTFAGTVIHTGSRFQTYLRTVAAIDERDGPPTIHPVTWRKQVARWRECSTHQDCLKRWLATRIDDYAREQLEEAASEMMDELILLRRGRSQINAYLAEHATPLEELYETYDYGPPHSP